jgi:hypothetical protein
MRILIVAGVVAGLAAAPVTATARKPVMGKTAVVRPVSGNVRIKPAGSTRYRLLAAKATIKMGSTIDATHGKVRVVTASNTRGATQAGTFYDGAFVVTQERKAGATTDLTLAQGKFSSCPAAGAAGARTAATRRPVRRLWGSARGRFRTRGRYAAATVRGTTWLTEDFCDTSRAKSANGSVVAGVNQRGSFTKRVLRGAQFTLKAGQSFEIYCDERKPLADAYCVSVLSQPADNLFGFSLLLLNTSLTDYRLCMTGPDHPDCGTFALTAPDENNFRGSSVVCFPGQGPGDYSTTWSLAGEVVPVPIRFKSTLPPESLSCISSP